MTRAATRDASWYPHPNESGVKLVHVDNGDEFARCNSTMLLGSLAWSSLADVPEHLRCKRSACAAAYAREDIGAWHGVADSGTPDPTGSST